MKLFKDKDGQVFAFEDDGSQDDYISPELIPISEEEANALRFPKPPITQLKADALKQIDGDVDDIYRDVIGNRESEYALAEAEAKAFAAAGYPDSNVPASVQAWAAAKNKTATWAADDIIATADSWRTVQANLRTKRLAMKEAVRSAVDQAGVDAALAEWGAYVVTTRTTLGI